jgi:DNA modification methylase
MLTNIKSIVKPFYETINGSAYLGDSLELMKFLPDNSINLILTSPPFALTRQKEYGNKPEQEYLNWFMHFAKEFYRLIKPDGSLAA